MLFRLSRCGGFLGASFAYAFDRGVNRGLYSNEAGKGQPRLRMPQRALMSLRMRHGVHS